MSNTFFWGATFGFVIAGLLLPAAAMFALSQSANNRAEGDLNGDRQVTLEDFSVALNQLEVVTAVLRAKGVTTMPL